MEIVDRRLSIYANFDNKGDKILAKFDPKGSGRNGLLTADINGEIDSFPEVRDF